jgi:outer membrane protein OmpA-like peptidoglycan-associated protein
MKSARSILFILTLHFIIPNENIAQFGNIPVLNIQPDTVVKLDVINSPFRETNLCLTPDGRYLFFLSGRGGMPWSDPDYTTYRGQVEADGDIYMTKKENGSWSAPVCLGQNVNTEMGEDEPNVRPDGQFVIFQSWREGWDKEGGPYYISELSGESWGSPIPLGGGIHQFFLDMVTANDWMYATDGSGISPDGNIFIFAAAKLYDQPMDLYMSLRKDGKWTYPFKMDISTGMDDRSVFIAADGKTVFFSSDGYGGFGGLDIFKTVISDDGSHEEIINLGRAFNTSADDYGFTMNSLGTEIFYLRDADIIYTQIDNPDILLRPLPTLLINGIVTDYYGNPVEASIRVINNQSKKTVADAKSNSISGEYSLSIRKIPGDYRKEAASKSYINYTEDFSIKDAGTPEVITDHILLKKENTELIFFDLDKDSIPAAEYVKLDSIVTFLFKNKRSNVLLSGHADQSGGDNYNLELSKRRVENVMKYLESRGIPAFIMKMEYYGEKQPLIKLKLKRDLYLNRRVEIEIVPPKQ